MTKLQRVFLQGRALVAAVVDFCGPCFDADMNMAAPLFAALSGRDGGVNPQLAVSWEWTDCSLFINTTIKVREEGNRAQ